MYLPLYNILILNNILFLVHACTKGNTIQHILFGADKQHLLYFNMLLWQRGQIENITGREQDNAQTQIYFLSMKWSAIFYWHGYCCSKDLLAVCVDIVVAVAFS
ncbi:hypothetical protein ACJX0J_039784 [Zea mays]